MNTEPCGSVYGDPTGRARGVLQKWPSRDVSWGSSAHCPPPVPRLAFVPPNAIHVSPQTPRCNAPRTASHDDPPYRARRDPDLSEHRTRTRGRSTNLFGHAANSTERSARANTAATHHRRERFQGHTVCRATYSDVSGVSDRNH